MSFPKDDIATKLLVSLLCISGIEVLIRFGHDPRSELSGLNCYLSSPAHSKVKFLQVTRYPSCYFQYVSSIVDFFFFFISSPVCHALYFYLVRIHSYHCWRHFSTLIWIRSLDLEILYFSQMEFGAWIQTLYI